MDYQLHEGSIVLADGFKDRTVNMFVLGDSVPAPLNISLSRDDMLPRRGYERLHQPPGEADR